MRSLFETTHELDYIANDGSIYTIDMLSTELWLFTRLLSRWTFGYAFFGRECIIGALMFVAFTLAERGRLMLLWNQRHL